MRHLRPYLIALCLVWLALPIGVAAAEGVADARRAHAEAAQALTEVSAARDALSRESEALAAEIAAEKANLKTVLPGVGGGALDRKLKAAQVLGERLEDLDRRVEAAEGAAEITQRALVSALEHEIAALRRSLPGASPAERRPRFDQLKRLIDERRRLTAEVQVAAQPAPVTLPPIDGAEDASPDELRELADEVRDHEEKVRGRLKTLEDRLTALRDRRQVLQAAQDFATDSNLFGEDERNRRIARVAVEDMSPGRGNPDNPSPPVSDSGNESPAVGGDLSSGEGFEAAPPQAGGGRGEFDGAEGAGDPVAEPGVDGPAFEPPPVGVPVTGPSGDAGGDLTISQDLDPQLLIGDPEDLSPADLAEHIERMEAQRAALRKTAKALKDRTADLERKAMEIEEAP